jgi:hypothetical protein
MNLPHSVKATHQYYNNVAIRIALALTHARLPSRLELVFKSQVKLGVFNGR